MGRHLRGAQRPAWEKLLLEYERLSAGRDRKRYRRGGAARRLRDDHAIALRSDALPAVARVGAAGVEAVSGLRAPEEVEQQHPYANGQADGQDADKCEENG